MTTHWGSEVRQLKNSMRHYIIDFCRITCVMAKLLQWLEALNVVPNEYCSFCSPLTAINYMQFKARSQFLNPGLALQNTPSEALTFWK